LYRQAAAWTAEIAEQLRGSPRIWDLYCGLGGFALHMARALPRARLTGVEVSAQAIEGAREAATAAGTDHADFRAADATAWAAARRRPPPASTTATSSRRTPQHGRSPKPTGSRARRTQWW